MRGLSLERKILLLMVLPILGGLIPGALLIFRANRNLAEMRTLEQLSSLVDRLSEIEARLHQEGSNWYIFNPTRVLVANEERVQERKKTDAWRSATDAAIVNYQQRLAATDSRIFSPMLQEALARIATRCAGLAALRSKVDNQTDETVGSVIMAGYRDFESDVNAVLPHLIDDTTSDVIVRKLTVIPKLMRVQKMMTESGGMVFYYHQLRQDRSKRTFTPSEAIEMIHNADLAEREWTELIAISQEKQREHLTAVHESADWKLVVSLVRGHGVAALENTAPPISDLSTWDPKCWNFINSGLDAEIAALRTDFTETCASMERVARHQRLLFSVGMFIGVGLMFAMTRLLAHSLGRPIIAMTQQLLQDAERSSAEAKTVRDSSSSVAEGSTSQAAALGETTATLDSISAVARSNAQNAEEAQRVACETRAAAEHGASRIERLREAMGGLRESGADVTRIIKTIDEIAFQTNILALNAAVEAARAGEAGAGFAVVADEVRSLAKRSADAARESTDKINAAASRTEAGVSITQEAVETLNGILEKARAVEGRVNSITEATREQKSGIDQIAGAIAEIDRVTHRNASAADQTANSAQELLVRADGFRVAVYRLRAIVFGGGAQRRSPGKPAAEPVNRLAQDKAGKTTHPFRKRAEGVRV